MRRFLSAPLDLGAPDVSRLVLRLALPSVAGLSISALHHLANAAFLGMLGPDAVAAVSFVFPLAILLAALGEAIGIGTAALVSRLLGAGRGDDANGAATRAVALAVAVGLVATALVLPALDPILLAFGTTPAALAPARAYAGLLVLGTGLTLLQILADFIAIAEGNTRFSMWTLIVCFALNIALDPLFLFVFDWGVAGAAAATLTAQALVMTAWLVYFAGGFGRVRIRPRSLASGRGSLQAILAVGAPAGLASVVAAAALMLVYRTAGAYGEASVAGLGIALRLLAAGTLPIAGFCLGAQGVLGYGWGTGDHVRVRRAARFMALVTTGFALAYAGVMTAAAGPVVALFTADAGVRAVAGRALVAVHLFFAFHGLQMVLVALLRATGRARLAALVTLAPQGYLLLPLVLVLPRFWGLDGLIAAPAIASGLSSVLAAFLLLREMLALERRADGAQITSAVSGQVLQRAS
ncbi:MATE family efflux transporter [Chelatococcus sp. SYSU_G07232]|uniref:MATE family efflux transporter n=1 Tax=Chelatococcus albus TaxID=3047466 RepID=A0ABT7ABC7_9HYPH|nr:MATE family efflux transporter [Chelatococcus sp. SYSU_G07232]MDJ1156676.1 MATE family efflux transporter [Chelatococcus sp. SYSU_G07232]